MDGKNCPACGTLLNADAAVCPVCGLGELDRTFLSKGERENWTQQVLKPFMEKLAPRVFAGAEHLLILTGDGTLYGFGSNETEQICENGPVAYSSAHLIAENVMDAAAGRHYTIYVTRDGRVHLQGRGIFADRFSGFFGAKRVFARHDQNQFWILDEQDRVFCFGDNQCSGKMLPLQRQFLMDLPEETCTVGFGRHQETIQNGTHGVSTFYRTWDNVSGKTSELKDQIRKTAVYRIQGNIYGNSNIELNLRLDSCQVLEGKCSTDHNRKELRKYTPQLHLVNNMIFAPVKDPEWDQWKSAGRRGSVPVWLDVEETERAAEIKKICVMDRDMIILRKDGQPELWISSDEEPFPDWNGQNAADVALGSRYGVVAYYGGDVAVFDRSEWEYRKPDWKTDRILLKLPGKERREN